MLATSVFVGVNFCSQVILKLVGRLVKQIEFFSQENL